MHPLDEPDTGIARGKEFQGLETAVRRVVINENDLPVESLKSGVETLYQYGDVFALVQGRHDDAEVS